MTKIILWQPNGFWDKLCRLWLPIKETYGAIQYDEANYVYVIANRVKFIPINKVRKEDIIHTYEFEGELDKIRIYIDRLAKDGTFITQKDFLLNVISFLRLKRNCCNGIRN